MIGAGRNSGHRPDETKRIDNSAIKISSPAIAPSAAAMMKDPKRKKVRIGEIAGGKMAECAAIFCCCPCGLANLFFLVAVRLPAGICCRAVQKRILTRRAKKKTEILESGSGSGSGSNSGCSSGSCKSGSGTDDGFAEFIGNSWPARSPASEVVEFEKEVWSKFCGRGFWRSLSQKDDS